ncbi:cytochrome c biogenesis protein CcsA [Haloferula sp. BvORR071]|uniref:cytochrome c biogenesis protein n=1 Tax=Haloferula sp. BvORR071 TaxID=1396141 RepID=UPI0005585AAC|nr:cytochrome c biogenesis protein CcsA [Haloferula sp. BvORR071]
MNATIGRWIVFSLGLCAFLGVLLWAALGTRTGGEVRSVPGYKPWPAETVEMASLLPVQDGGRVKPLGTFASFTMLSLHGARSMEIAGPDGKKLKLTPLEWMLDCFFRPELAKELPTFRIDNSEVITAVGISARERRDRYSYNELKPGLDQLKEAATTYSAIDADLRKGVEKQTLELYSSIQVFEALTAYMDFARYGLLPRSESKDSKIISVSEVMDIAPKVRAAMQSAQASGQGLPPEVMTIQKEITDRANESNPVLKLFPPGNKEDDTWVSAGDRMFNIFTGTTREPEQSIKDVRMLENLARSLPEGDGAFREKFSELESSVVARATARGEYRAIKMEANYFRKNWLINALVCFLLATVVSAVMLFTGDSFAGKISYWATVGLLVTGLFNVIIPIVTRCIIMQRPPVGNLYDTIIFINMALVIFALLVLWMTKKRFVLGITPIVAAFLIVLARAFEQGEAKDHLDPLIAVLRSNFWLSTHVISITLGYAAGLITALISVVYVLLRTLGLDNGDSAQRRSVTRAVYGCLGLTLCLSLIGTVLGGIWANDSWGRFWGWDPKENGALMIVLWTLAILHARLGGYIREWGLHLCSMFGAIVVAFSWWHVNFLGIGLHNYGFAADKVRLLYAFYGVMALFILWGGIACLIDRFQSAGKEKEKDLAPGKKVEV